MRYLTLALPKGRLAVQVAEMLKEIGVTCGLTEKNSRKLVDVNEELKWKFFLSKAQDVPTYVEYGAADIGVAGKDTLLEENRRLYQVLDLGMGKCRMVVAGLPEMKEKLHRNNDLRVATKYPNIAKEYFYHQKQQTVEIIKLNGSVELGAIVGLADVVVDIVETGSTLKENGLWILEEICPVSAILVVNRVSMKTEYKRITQIVDKLKNLIGEGNEEQCPELPLS